MKSTTTAMRLRQGIAASSNGWRALPDNQRLRQGLATRARTFGRAAAPAPLRASTAFAQRRAFTAAAARQFADVTEEFDPRTIERESDEVDVCIVGGGRFVPSTCLTLSNVNRSRWTRCCDKVETTCK
jgi:hypothetical protein